MLKMFEEGIDYQFLEIEDSDLNAFKLLTGKYKDVIYCYGAANVREQGEAATLQFDYVIISSGTYTVEQLTQDQEFHTMIGDLLVQLITIESENESSRNNNTEKFDLQ